jgi:hypothetical protein
MDVLTPAPATDRLVDRLKAEGFSDVEWAVRQDGTADLAFPSSWPPPLLA